MTRRPHKDRRKVVHEQLANLIRQLALTRSEIDSLPDTLLTTVREKKFPTEFDLDDPTSPFLPPDLMEDRSAWICFSRASSPVAFHAKRNRWRSAFFQFMRLPDGQDATINYLNNWNAEKAFPVGTQVALLQRSSSVSGLPSNDRQDLSSCGHCRMQSAMSASHCPESIIPVDLIIQSHRRRRRQMSRACRFQPADSGSGLHQVELQPSQPLRQQLVERWELSPLRSVIGVVVARPGCGASGPAHLELRRVVSAPSVDLPCRIPNP